MNTEVVFRDDNGKDWTHDEMFDPKRWFDLPKTYRMVRLYDNSTKQRIIGLRIRHFMDSLQNFVSINMSLSEGMRYLFYYAASDVSVIWLNDEGMEIEMRCHVYRNSLTNAIKLTSFNGNPVIKQAGSETRYNLKDEPDLLKEVWFDNSGSMLYQLNVKGQHLSGGQSYSSYDIELEAMRNRMGLTKIGRDVTNTCIAEKYQLKVGDTVKVMKRNTTETLDNHYKIVVIRPDEVVLHNEEMNENFAVNKKRVIKITDSYIW